MVVMLNACTMQEICERKVIQRKIKRCILVSRNVAMQGYCAGYCFGASLLRAKPENYPKVSMPFVEKVGRVKYCDWEKS